VSAAGSRRRERGQGLVEFAITVPVFMLILLGMLEFGFAFTHDQTIAYASREGARTGAALGNGSTTYPCTTADFDAPVIAAVERVLTSTGSPIAIGQISEIDIYLAKSDGTQTSGEVNRWLPAPASGPVVDGKSLDFKATTSQWLPCTRNNGVDADAMGVSVNYSYHYVTPLSGIMRFFGGSGGSTLPISDKTVMNLNPTN
jgi:Flp pilus assembly protein TadG